MASKKWADFTVTKENALEKQRGESTKAYRSFLLWCMQAAAEREVSCVARAVGGGKSTIYEFVKRWKWEERGKQDLTSDIKAQAIYRELFFKDYGMSEISCVEKNIAGPVSVTGTTPRSVTESVNVAVAKTKSKNVFEKEVQRKHLMLIDAAIGYIAQGIKEGDIRRTLRDLPTLLALRKELTDDGGQKESNRLISESARVKDAKANNEDIVEAMFEDAQEITAVLGSLRMRGKSQLQLEKETTNE